eukprot:2499369-Rhodomonas_salina.2
MNSLFLLILARPGDGLITQPIPGYRVGITYPGGEVPTPESGLAMPFLGTTRHGNPTRRPRGYPGVPYNSDT